ncbi:MAG TPA: ChbG/HpnK family deacetylase [Burkholderiaceae bacterium]|nr:ChbG/HpnK family deacetylase [Burkholderiaceae bacterium]
MSGDAAKPRPPRRWVVCADDFALDRGAIDATLALIKLGRVTATSALVDSPNWKAAAPDLKAVSDRADVGLHLNLTEALEPGSSTWRLPLLLVQSMLRLLPRWRVRALVERQLDAFTDAFGRLPDFIDGHHHVHQLPVVRDVLIESVLAREPKSLPWLRICLPPLDDEDYKARVIGMLGAASLMEMGRQAGFPTSGCLVGVYRFNLRRDAYLVQVRKWLAAATDGTVFMCHPSTRASPKDPIGAARRMELGVLAAEPYANALTRAGVIAVRGSEIFKPRPAAAATLPRQAEPSDSRIS